MRALAAIVVLASAAGAPALGEEPRFGQKGQIVPLGSLSFSYSSVAPDLGSVTTVSLGPTLLWFVADDIALGGSATLVRRTVSQGDGSATVSSYGVAPTAAYNLRLSPPAPPQPRRTSCCSPPGRRSCRRSRSLSRGRSSLPLRPATTRA